MKPEEHATRIAAILGQAMNAMALIVSAQQGKAIDGRALHEMLGALIGELRWLDAHRGDHPVEGLAWRADAADCIARLSAALDAWDPSGPVPPSVVTSGAECLGFATSQ